MTTPAAAAPAKATGKPAAPPPAPWPFQVGVLKTENPDYDQTITQTTTAVQAPNYTIEPTGWLNGLWYQFDMTITGQSVNSVTYSENNPFSVVQKITFKDTGNREVFGPLSGYDWMCINKFGGYFNQGDPRADIAYVASTGTGATAGSFTFLLYLPLQLVARDSLGTIENKSDSSAYKVELWIDSQAETYNQVPSVQGSLRIRVTTDGYTEPAAASAGGKPVAQTPPAVGLLQYWTSENANLGSGTASYNLENGIGYPIRNILYKALDTSDGTRASGDADWPDPVTLTYGKVQLFQRYKTTWISKMGRLYNLTSSTPDTARGRENGVFPVSFMDDFGLSPGAELRNGYLQTKVGTVLKWKGSNGAALNLFAAVNYVIPPNNNYYGILSGR